MAYTIVDKPPPPRAPETLIRAPIPAQDPSTLAPGAELQWVIPYDQVAPGIYPDETVVKLDTGELVAVSVERKRRAGGSTMEFRVWARWIMDDGRTMRDRHFQEVENEFSIPVDVGYFDSSKVGARTAEDEISRELVRLMLGEEPATKEVFVDEAAAEAQAAALPADLDPDTWFDPTAAATPIIALSDAVKAEIGIREAIRQATVEPEADMGALLASK